jgi:hypothetical protein
MLINRNEINSIWINRSPPRNNVIVDGTYEIVDKALIIEKLFPLYWKWLSAMKLTKWLHKWDCDNFSLAFKLFSDGFFATNIDSEADSIAIGMIHYIAERKAEDGKSGSHAINVAISLENNTLIPLFIEPQNGQIIPLSSREYNSISMIYI